MKDINHRGYNVYKGFSFIVCLTIVTLILSDRHVSTTLCRPLSVYGVELFVPPWLLVIGVSQTSLIVGVSIHSSTQ